MARPVILLIWSVALGFSGCDSSDKTCEQDEGRVYYEYSPCSESFQCQDAGVGDLCFRGQCTSNCDAFEDHSAQCAPYEGKEPLCIAGHCTLPCVSNEDCPVAMACTSIATSPYKRCTIATE